MEDTAALSTFRDNRIVEFIRSLGPGIMMAAAAVGGSHLVASTKAGAMYGWQLAVLILVVNLFKYPFFRAGVQYTMGTGRSLVQGYDHLGKPYLWIFTVLCTVSAIINTAALLLFTTSLLSYFIPAGIPAALLPAGVLAVCLLILTAGQYRALDSLSKIIMITLTTATVAAAVIAFSRAAPAAVSTPELSPWTIAGIGFLVVTMGWMPAPIEISTINSVWLKAQRRQQNVTARSAMTDFNIGYIGTALLALVFLALGALVLHGSGVVLEKSGVGFSHQLVSIYASTIGEWSRYLIAVIAFFCIFGSTITVIDGYSRVIAESQQLILNKADGSGRSYQLWIVLISASALAILILKKSALIPMLDFAMVMAFITTPFFALLNFILVRKSGLPAQLTNGKMMNILSWSGLIYLFGFLAVFIWWKWLM